jgi:hypothetical protein
LKKNNNGGIVSIYESKQIDHCNKKSFLASEKKSFFICKALKIITKYSGIWSNLKYELPKRVDAS